MANFVRGEFGPGRDTAVHIPAPPRPIYASPVSIQWEDVALQYLSSCERELVFSGYASAVARNSGEETLARLHSLLTHPMLGNAANGRNVPLDVFSDNLRDKIDQNERLLFVFPGFPFKDQNDFRTLGGPTDFDLAEIALLIRLHTLSVAIYQTYHMGADWLILTDGSAFSDALRVSESETRDYQERLRTLRNTLDIGRAVSFVNFWDLRRFVDQPEGYWHRLLAHVFDTLSLGILDQDAAVDPLAVLTRGMKRNVNLKDLRGDTSWEDWWNVLHSSRDHAGAGQVDLWDEVDRVCRESAIKYAAFNLASKWVDLERHTFPTSIRATIHAKRGQLAVPKIGSEFPWNGTAFINDERVGVRSVSCRPLHELAAQGIPIVPYRDETGRILFVSH
ncbi:L-tyrosine/L-tryptophan isonitrile synthase family protein [Kribbella sp. NPDC056861]|uniref:L-tyrosine/L-tryptophan isonitrile synthase family protein n=1 Tax=Kribbella sp. NPDC056861 TaxID=3154857 RepID=UPI00342967EC